MAHCRRRGYPSGVVSSAIPVAALAVRGISARASSPTHGRPGRPYAWPRACSRLVSRGVSPLARYPAPRAPRGSSCFIFEICGLNWGSFNNSASAVSRSANKRAGAPREPFPLRARLAAAPMAGRLPAIPLEILRGEAVEADRRATSENTAGAHRSDWESWCKSNAQPPIEIIPTAAVSAGRHVCQSDYSGRTVTTPSRCS
jgi:hypothetical protein